MPNGDLPDSELRPIAGGGKLAVKPAAGWNAFAAYVYDKTGIRVSASEAYRTLARQRYFWDLYQSGQGNLAAYPGTSNHGMGLAVDLREYAFRALVDTYGAKFGWSKSWSDAPSEWWHILYQAGHYDGPDPGPDYQDTPSWWKRVTRAIRKLRIDIKAKKIKRQHAKTNDRKEKLHRQIGRMKDHVDSLKHRKDAA